MITGGPQMFSVAHLPMDHGLWAPTLGRSDPPSRLANQNSHRTQRFNAANLRGESRNEIV